MKQVRWLIKRPWLIAILAFALWMLFADANSYLAHHELDKEIDKLERTRERLGNNLVEDSIISQQLSDSLGMERYAREKYYMKRQNEDVFIIEFKDSIDED